MARGAHLSAVRVDLRSTSAIGACGGRIARRGGDGGRRGRGIRTARFSMREARGNPRSWQELSGGAAEVMLVLPCRARARRRRAMRWRGGEARVVAAALLLRGDGDAALGGGEKWGGGEAEGGSRVVMAR